MVLKISLFRYPSLEGWTCCRMYGNRVASVYEEHCSKECTNIIFSICRWYHNQPCSGSTSHPQIDYIHDGNICQFPQSVLHQQILCLSSLFHKVVVKRSDVIFEKCKQHRTNRVHVTDFHWHKEEFDWFNYALFSDYFVCCVTGVNKIYSGDDFVCWRCALPLILESKFFVTDVDVVIRGAVINIEFALSVAW